MRPTKLMFDANIPPERAREKAYIFYIFFTYSRTIAEKKKVIGYGT